jgi:hypothetical protein
MYVVFRVLWIGEDVWGCMKFYIGLVEFNGEYNFYTTLLVREPQHTTGEYYMLLPTRTPFLDKVLVSTK